MNVYLFRGNHPLYETFTNYPPAGVNYLPKRESHGPEEYTLYTGKTGLMRTLLDGSLAVAGLPRFVPVPRKYDLVHSSRGFLAVGPNRFVVDIEHISSFAGMRHKMLSVRRFRKITEKVLLSKKCSALLPHSEAAMRTVSLLSNDRRIAEKSTVVYPAIQPPGNLVTRRDDAEPHLLFIGEYLWKGGREFLEACETLADKLDFRVTYISLRVHPPEPVIRHFSRILNVNFIEGPIPRESLMAELYPETDVFVMPTYIDTFGYSYLEAMAHGIPCIGCRIFAVPEIINDHLTGLLVDPATSFFDARGLGHPEMSLQDVKAPNTVRQLSDAIGELIGSRSLRERMGTNALKETRSGRFSVAQRNKQLKEIYERSMAV